MPKPAASGGSTVSASGCTAITLRPGRPRASRSARRSTASACATMAVLSRRWPPASAFSTRRPERSLRSAGRKKRGRTITSTTASAGRTGVSGPARCRATTRARAAGCSGSDRAARWRMADGFTVPNGPGWPGDGLLHRRQPGRRNLPLRLRPGGRRARRRRARSSPASRPAGRTAWRSMPKAACGARAGTGCIARFTPGGAVDRIVDMPVSRPTSRLRRPGPRYPRRHGHRRHGRGRARRRAACRRPVRLQPRRQRRSGREFCRGSSG